MAYSPKNNSYNTNNNNVRQLNVVEENDHRGRFSHFGPQRAGAGQQTVARESRLGETATCARLSDRSVCWPALGSGRCVTATGQCTTHPIGRLDLFVRHAHHAFEQLRWTVCRLDGYFRGLVETRAQRQLGSSRLSVGYNNRLQVFDRSKCDQNACVDWRCNDVLLVVS